MVAEILLWILVLARIVIGVSLTRTALRRNVRNLLWLAAVFYVNGFFNIFYTRAFYNVFLFFIGAIPDQVCLILFIRQTFYRDRQSPWVIFMAITLLGGLAMLLVGLNDPTSGAIPQIVSVVLACNWLWHTVIAVQAYRVAASDRVVEDWVKARYRLMIAYCGIGLLLPVLGGLNAVFEIPRSVSRPIIGLVSIASIVLQYLAWVMPAGYRRWLNRNYQPPVEDEAELALSEEEIMQRLKT